MGQTGRSNCVRTSTHNIHIQIHGEQAFNIVSTFRNSSTQSVTQIYGRRSQLTVSRCVNEGIISEKQMSSMMHAYVRHSSAAKLSDPFPELFDPILPILSPRHLPRVLRPKLVQLPRSCQPIAMTKAFPRECRFQDSSTDPTLRQPLVFALWSEERNASECPREAG
jgi:hypothetical protein